jgi:hypothetical protein
LVAAGDGCDYSGGKGCRRIRQWIQGVPERSRDPLRDLTFRELALPWVNSILINDLLQGKALVEGHGVAAAY